MKALLIFWQLPQFIIGLVLSLFFRPWKKENLNGIDITFCKTTFKFCFSLGMFIFAPAYANDIVLRHESGHSVQSKYLGWFYLAAVGVPSVLLYSYKRLTKKDELWYHSHYPENWADKISGIKFE